MADALLTVDNLTKSFGDKLLFEDISFGIGAGQKCALIARNGYGKTTLLNIIMTAAGLPGHNTLQDSGSVTLRAGLRLAYLPQSGDDGLGAWRSVGEFIGQSARPDNEDPWAFEQRVEEITTRMGVAPMMERPMSTLSGGEQKKAALCRLLIECTGEGAAAHSLLVLDEPTNHLDIGMIEWLEEFLSRQRLALLMVTHDRYFLDNVCHDIFELDNARLYHYRPAAQQGSVYAYYLEKKAEREANERAEVAKAKSLYRTELEWMRRMPQARGTKAQARIDAFHELERKAHTRFDDTRPQFTVKTERIGGKILELYNIHHSAAGRTLIDDFTYLFKRGEKTGIVGPNGAGKSTLLNIMTGQLRPQSGRVSVGQTIQFGYYTQEGLRAPADRRVIDLVKDVAEQIELEGGRSMTAHQFLSHFGFDGTTQYNYFGNLSGGERRRLYLLLVLMANPNFLILDEPTNDLDIYTLQTLEQFLRSYKGCLVIVSHDRSFMDHIVDHLLVFEGDGRIRDYHSDYTDYRQERELEQKRQRQQQPREAAPARERQQPQRRRATYKEQREYETLTAEIDALGAERAALERLLCSPQSPDEASAASVRIGEVMALLDEKELRWLELDELM
ncbi:MAG: ABC-F family ATP-binding cassette domain-containing protein [Bacteroidales bacterium]|nr:ABC-F family ATP-binding cassette domain-containing protein [Bacteroidales bacterium]